VIYATLTGQSYSRKQRVTRMLTSNIEYFKEASRQLLYPLYSLVLDWLVRMRYQKVLRDKYDKVSIGQRGNHFRARHSVVNRERSIEGKAILVIGCGAGDDIDSWLRFNPKSLIAIDFMDYKDEWSKKAVEFSKSYVTSVSFFQADAVNLSMIHSNSIDFVCSDAVYQHLQNYAGVLKELTRVLKPKGIMYAAMGPLYYSYSGDMVSGSDNTGNGYNHILLDSDKYATYFNSTFDSRDPRAFYFEHKMFSFLKSDEYITEVEKLGYSRLYLACILSKKGLNFRERHQEKFHTLLEKYSETDLLLDTLSFIYEKS
jgi:ubiquinone/menaquinone biosynthesis C-methylase UbiE